MTAPPRVRLPVARNQPGLSSHSLPESLQPTVAYGVAVVKGAKNEAAAKAFVEGLLDGDGKRALDDAGFEPPPAQ